MLEIVEGLERPGEISELFGEYTGTLLDICPGFGKYLEIQRYDAEIADLGFKYSRPWGRLHAAVLDGRTVGCGGLRKLDDEKCELKRLYVKPEARGRGIAGLLLDKLIAGARETGCKEMFLDTLPELKDALGMYERRGFVFTEPYNDSPVDSTLFLKLELPK